VTFFNESYTAAKHFSVPNSTFSLDAAPARP
jgi:hypothetical protein